MKWRKIWPILLIFVIAAIYFFQPEQSRVTPNQESVSYTGSPYVAVNNNEPDFTEEELKAQPYEFYADLDYLGRCGYAMACLSRDLMPTEDDDKGTSLVFVHSEKGQTLMDQLQSRLLLKPVDPELAASRNSAMVRSVTAHHFRQYFFHCLGKTSFDHLVHSCFQPSLPVRLHRMAIMKLSNLLRRSK